MSVADESFLASATPSSITEAKLLKLTNQNAEIDLLKNSPISDLSSLVIQFSDLIVQNYSDSANSQLKERIRFARATLYTVYDSPEAVLDAWTHTIRNNAINSNNLFRILIPFKGNFAKDVVHDAIVRLIFPDATPAQFGANLADILTKFGVSSSVIPAHLREVKKILVCFYLESLIRTLSELERTKSDRPESTVMGDDNVSAFVPPVRPEGLRSSASATAIFSLSTPFAKVNSNTLAIESDIQNEVEIFIESEVSLGGVIDDAARRARIELKVQSFLTRLDKCGSLQLQSFQKDFMRMYTKIAARLSAATPSAATIFAGFQADVAAFHLSQVRMSPVISSAPTPASQAVPRDSKGKAMSSDDDVEFSHSDSSGDSSDSSDHPSMSGSKHGATTKEHRSHKHSSKRHSEHSVARSLGYSARAINEREASLKANHPINSTGTEEMSIAATLFNMNSEQGLLMVNTRLHHFQVKVSKTSKSLRVRLLSGGRGKTPNLCGYSAQNPLIFPQAELWFNPAIESEIAALQDSLHGASQEEISSATNWITALLAYKKKFNKLVKAASLDNEDSHITTWSVFLLFHINTFTRACVHGDPLLLLKDFDIRFKRPYKDLLLVVKKVPVQDIRNSACLVGYFCPSPSCGMPGMSDSQCFNCDTKSTKSGSSAAEDALYQAWKAVEQKTKGANYSKAAWQKATGAATAPKKTVSATRISE